MLRRLGVVLLLGAASAARAQVGTGTLTIRETNDVDQIINIAECNNSVADGLVFTWTVSDYIGSGTYALVASDQAGCPTGTSSTATNVTLAASVDATAATGGYPTSGSVNVSTLLAQLKISCTGTATAVYFCVSYSGSGSYSSYPYGTGYPYGTYGTGYTGTTTTTTYGYDATGSLTLDLALPPAPIVDTPTAGDTALNVSWSAGAGSTANNTLGSSASYEVVATSQTDPTDRHTRTVTSATSARVEGLKNGVTYDVIVYAFSPGGNQSAASTPVSGTPIAILDFWRLYQADGGRERGGCGSGPGSLAALLALIPLALRRRRRS